MGFALHPLRQQTTDLRGVGHPCPRHGAKHSSPWKEGADLRLQERQGVCPEGGQLRKKPAKEAFTINTAPVKASSTPVKASSTPVKISCKIKTKEIKRDEPFRTQDKYRNTLRELEQKTYPFPDSDMAAMLDDLLEKEVIELPEYKRPEEMHRVNDPKYCKYHRIVGHPVGKCFILKELIMRLAQQGRIELDLEDTAATHTTTIVFGSFDPVPLQRTRDRSRQSSSHTTPSA